MILVFNFKIKITLLNDIDCHNQVNRCKKLLSVCYEK